MTTFEAIRKELDKCVLVCCRCHREIHDGWHSQYLVYEDSDRTPDLGEDDLDFDAMTFGGEQEVLDCLAGT